MTTELIIRIFIAALLGGAIGLEREYRAKEAGFRTHFLVALGSALFMVISQYGFGEVLSSLNKASFDPSRIASQVVTGIGFIGTGTIIFQKHVLKGLTTAAGLWVTAAIGLTCGSGMFALAIVATIFVLICLEALNWVLHRFGSKNIAITFSTSSKENIQRILKQMKEEDADLDTYEMKELKTSSGSVYEVSMEVKVRRNKYQSKILQLMEEFEGVTIETIE
ncbi:MAG: MgtC/SapB family protein [Prevotella sp.]|jgi:putative Mg2+ transporter-C (MgtC) family protein|nr:MgtC/SapB family protein [Prevotella sp.]MCI2081439.1 MgtC/SapB family protein [Prevotella sp.]MCI2103319.1 MgtC/SapB family protein [Prevotella sp.]